MTVHSYGNCFYIRIRAKTVVKNAEVNLSCEAEGRGKIGDEGSDVLISNRHAININRLK